MSGLTLFRRKNQSQALVQAPSMDLIVSDTGPRIPEPVEVTCRMTAEKFKTYMESINYTKNRNITVDEESLKQVLKILGCKCYPNTKVAEFLKQQTRNLSKTKKLGKQRTSGLYNKWRTYSDYNNFLPPRIVNKIQEIKNHPYSHLASIYCWISDIGRDNHGFIFDGRHDTEICFLALFHINLDVYYDVRKTALIIDAWRGPTFSDEKACLPGQTKT